MTSSLVGSEMCIRDSLSNARIKTCTLCLELLILALRRLEPARAVSDGPVSYTHLTLPTICSV
eukprot:1563349-Prorocentrum_lima.AAC.1